MKTFLISLLLATICFFTYEKSTAQTSSSPLIFNQGEAKAIGGTTADSLLAGDTLTYYIQVKAVDRIQSLIHLYYDETAGSQTVNITVYESNENREAEYTAVPKGTIGSTWVSGALTADANVRFSTERDTVAFCSRYYKIQAISSGASSKGTLRGFIKTYINR